MLAVRLLGVAMVVLAAPIALGSAAGTKSVVASAHPQIQVGGFPTGIALNPSTGTIYVGNGTWAFGNR